MADDLFDFGFTIVDEQELEAVQQATAKVETVSTSVSETQDRLDKLYNAITPLLNNLKKNPEKDYIVRQHRLEQVEQFEDHIQKIYQG